MRILSLVTIVLSLASSGPAQSPDDIRVALKRITPTSLKASLTFLASDAMKGRDTPSPELDKAAGWLAREFKEAGLKPAFAGSWLQGKHIGDAAAARGTLSIAGKGIALKSEHVIAAGPGSEIKNAPVTYWNGSWNRRDGARPAAVAGKAVLIDGPAAADSPRGFHRRLVRRSRTLKSDGAVAVLVTGKGPAGAVGSSDLPILRLPEGALKSLPQESGTLERMTLALTVPTSKQPWASNVGALLRGSDPVLAEDLIIFSAHYDHVGVGAPLNGDSIYNGADDDASGTASVLEIARTFAAMKTPPKRSCLFLCFYGEEKGMLGSRYYVTKPIAPLAAHKAVFNIEMVGRPDDIKQNEAWITGWRVSDFGKIVAASAKDVGIRLYEHPQRSRMLFGASDNISFATLGIPAHSFSAGSLHSDYHRPGDHIDKLDFKNMAAVVRGIAYSGWTMANGGPLPDWDADNRSANRYREARLRLK